MNLNMNKYIDADLLREKITEQMESLPREVGRGAGTITAKGYGMMEAFQIVRSIIDSLQQEQPEVDLDVDETEKDSLNKLIAKCREGRDCKAAWEFYTKAKTEEARKEE